MTKLGLADIRDWLKLIDRLTVADINSMPVKEANEVLIKQLCQNDSIIADYFYVGKLNTKKEKSVGVYQLNRDLPIVAIGGTNFTKIYSKPVSILIHYNKNARETEMKSLDIYEKLFNAKQFKIGKNFKVDYIELLQHEPVDVGTDDDNVYERVIEAIFYYQIIS